MRNKTVLISGANSGIGFATAHALARMGARIIMLCRNPSAGQKAQKTIVQATQNDKVHLMICDLLSVDSISNFAHEFNSTYDQLDVLYNNAGAVFYDHQFTPAGIEYNFMVNYLGHFWLTHLLLSHLKSAKAGRIINITGMYHTKGAIDFQNLQGEQHFRPFQAANNAQLAKGAVKNNLPI